MFKTFLYVLRSYLK